MDIFLLQVHSTTSAFHFNGETKTKAYQSTEIHILPEWALVLPLAGNAA